MCVIVVTSSDREGDTTEYDAVAVGNASRVAGEFTYRVKLNVEGKEDTYYTKEFKSAQSDIANIKKGDFLVVEIDDDTNEIVDVDVNPIGRVEKNVTIADLSVSSATFKVGSKTYRLADAEILDADYDPIRVSNLSNGDKVNVFMVSASSTYVSILVVTDEYVSDDDDDDIIADGGIVTYIDTTNKAIYIDGKAYVYSDNVVLKTAKGSIIATGADAVLGDDGALDEGDRVEVGKIVDDRVTELIGLEVASVQADADPINEEIEALPSVDEATLDDKDDVYDAKDSYDALPPYVKDFVKAENVAKLNALVAKMEQLQAEADAEAYAAKLETATKAVEKAEASQLLTDVTAAKTAITNANLNAVDKKTLEDRVEAIVIKVKDAEELNAALNAEVKAIVFTANITANITIDSEVTIDGAGKTLTGKVTIVANNVTIKNLIVDKNDPDKENWKTGDAYAVQAYRVTGIELENVTMKNANAALLVNGAEVKVINVKSVGNGFGGIEVSTTNDNFVPKLVVDGLSHDNLTKPAIWIDGAITNDGWVVAPGYTSTHIQVKERSSLVYQIATKH